MRELSREDRLVFATLAMMDPHDAATVVPLWAKEVWNRSSSGKSFQLPNPEEFLASGQEEGAVEQQRRTRQVDPVLFLKKWVMLSPPEYTDGPSKHSTCNLGLHPMTVGAPLWAALVASRTGNETKKLYGCEACGMAGLKVWNETRDEHDQI